MKENDARGKCISIKQIREKILFWLLPFLAVYMKVTGLLYGEWAQLRLFINTVVLEEVKKNIVHSRMTRKVGVAIMEDIIRGYEEDAVRMENELAEEIDELLAPFRKKIKKKQMAQLKAVIYEASFAAEAKAFRLGVRYASGLLGEVVNGE